MRVANITSVIKHGGHETLLEIRGSENNPPTLSVCGVSDALQSSIWQIKLAQAKTTERRLGKGSGLKQARGIQFNHNTQAGIYFLQDFSEYYIL